MSYPSSIDSFAGFTSTHTLAQDNHAAQHTQEQAGIVATETKVGTGTSIPTTGTILRGSGLGTSAWDTVHLSSDVQGVLGVNSGGTGQTTLTSLPLVSPAITGSVSGGATYSTPTLTTPTIADFSNANHSHVNAAGGGTLNAANALQAGSVSYANLLNTLFSGQTTTYTNPGTAGGTNSFFYVNQGGIKYFWGVTASLAIGNVSGFQVSGSFTITLPLGFFGTVQTVLLSCDVASGTAYLFPILNAKSATTVTVTLGQMNGTNGAAPLDVLVIGT